MDEKANKFFKFISRSLGFIFINFTITLLFLTFFANASLQETDLLKDELQSYALSQFNLTQKDFDIKKEPTHARRKGHVK